MKHASVLKFTLLAAVLVAGAGNIARADNDVADGTYVFTATDGNDVMDGSWVTFSGDWITSYNLVDTSITPAFWEPPAGLLPPLTTDNSSIIDLTTYDDGTGPDAFSFSIGSPVGVGSTDASAFWFEGQNNLNGFSALYDGFGNNTSSIVATDPIGIWTPDIDISVSDSSSTLELLTGAMAVLVACASLARPRQAARC